MTLGDRMYRNGARPVRTHQAGAVPGSMPRRSPTQATGGPFSSCGARRRGGNATGQNSHNIKTKDQPVLKIMQWNAEGVTNKKEELQNFLHQNNISICCIQETHLQEGKPFKIRGYQAFRSDRKGRRKGGVMTLVRNNICARETERFMEEAEYIQIKITTNNRSVDIVNYYCPNDKALSLEEIQIPNNHFLIAGDFNSQSQSWGYNVMDKRGEDIETWQDENNLILINEPMDTPTFYSRRWHSTTTPDLAFCTEDIHQNITRTVEDQLGGSDHRPVTITIKEGNTPTEPKLPRWNYKKANWGLYRIRTNELTKELDVEQGNINTVTKQFNAAIIKAAKEAIPRGVTKDYTPYWSNELQQSHDTLTKAREDAEREPSNENNINLQQCKAKHLRTKLECKRKSWREKTASLNMERDTRKLWNLTRKLNEEDSRDHRITLQDEEKSLTGKAAANAFVKAFENESNVDIPQALKKEIRKEQRNQEKGPVHDIMKAKITMTELLTAMKSLKKRKSPGPDNITNEMIENLGNTALKILLQIFNLSWKQGELPQCWKEAHMMPILKKGKDKSKVHSYRPISLTSCCCKLMERIINKRLNLYLETEKIIVTEQAGFRQYRSTEDQTTHLSQVIEDGFQAKKVTLATLIDLQKAFDKVWKDGLLAKLLQYGIKGNIYRWTKAYLQNRRARVIVDGKPSRQVLLRQGVPQGGVLSPTLFILFINDLVKEMPKGIHAALYADDLALWCTEEFATTATYRMQLALNRVTAWAGKWCVSINKEKTTATLFTLSNKIKPTELKIDNQPLKYEDQQTYLGVTFDKRMTWRNHITKAEAKARRKLNIMRKLAGTQWGANHEILKKVYQGTVRPHLEYGSSSWMTAAKSHQQALDRIQNQAMRIIAGAMKTTPIHLLEDLTAISPLIMRRQSKAMIQATKFQCIQEHPMGARLKQLSSGRLKRTSFVTEVKALQRKHKTKLPATLQPHLPPINERPWEDNLKNITINTTVQNLTKKNEQSNEVKKSLTMAMIEEQYPQESWIQVYTDGSATNAVKNGGAGIYIKYPTGEWQAEAIPTGLHCTNYKAEIEALRIAAEIISKVTDNSTQVVFLTDALSVLQALTSNNIPELDQALNNIRSFRTVLQWIPAHCGIQGNEQADKMAKLGATDEQAQNPVNQNEMKTIIKSLYKVPEKKDSYHQLSRQEQVTIFRLRTGHNRLNHHMFRKLNLVISPLCPCGEEDQDTAHVLQRCKNLLALRKEIWPQPTSLQEKLYGTEKILKKTASFISRAGLQV